MGFPENVLARDEKVVRSLHPHGWTVIGPALIGVILLAAGIALARYTPTDQDLVQWIAVGVLVLLAIPLVLVPILSWRTTHYVITSHRVMIRQGIVSKSGKDITLSKITDVSFEQSLLDRIINSGTLRVESAGDSPNEMFRNIPDSNEVQQVINRLIDEDANRRSALIHERIQRAEQVFDQDRDGRRASSHDEGDVSSTADQSAAAAPQSIPEPAGEAAAPPATDERSRTD